MSDDEKFLAECLTLSSEQLNRHYDWWDRVDRLMRMICERHVRIATLEAKLGEVKEALEWYSDGFKIMDHIDGTYTIHETWYQKARATLEEISK